MQLAFVRAYQVTDDIVSFEFAPVTPLVWTAGQSIKLELPTLMGAAERRFTISSAPYEKNITITTRLSDSDFKQSLARLTPGQRVQAYAIEGTFVWRRAPLPHLFVAAGIGMTPFHAIIKQRVYEQQPITATLLYGARAITPFARELTVWQKTNPGLTLQPVQGYISAAHIASQPQAQKRLVYIAGPSSMVDELSHDLIAKYDMPASHVLRDWFTGRLPKE